MNLNVEFDGVLHNCQFEQRSGNRLDWRARCTCGWIKYGTKAEVMNAAAVHDLDQYELDHE